MRTAVRWTRDRTIDRWVDTRWYRSTSSSTSAPVSCRRRLTSCSSRSHVGRWASTNASTSTLADPSSVAGMVGPQEPVVTGDAVVLDVQIAQLPVRALSALIDVTVVFVGYLIGVAAVGGHAVAVRFGAVRCGADHLHGAGRWWATRSSSRPPPAAGRWARWRWACAWCPTTAARNASARPCFAHWPASIEIWMFTGGPAVICSLLSPKGKRIGDIFAGTLVISERAPQAVTRRRRCRRSSRGGRRRCSCPGSAPSRPSWPVSSFPAHRNWIRSCATRWRTGSPPTSSRRSRRPRRPARRRRWYWPPCSPNATAGSWGGCRHLPSHRTGPPRHCGPPVRVSVSAAATFTADSSVAGARRLHPTVLSPAALNAAPGLSATEPRTPGRWLHERDSTRSSCSGRPAIRGRRRPPTARRD